MNALKAHLRLLESGLPRTTHLCQEPPNKRGRQGASLPPMPIIWNGQEFKSLSHAASELKMARQTIKKRLGIE